MAGPSIWLLRLTMAIVSHGCCSAPVKIWCGRRDSTPHDFHHRNLNPARLPVPPRPPRARHSLRGLQRVRLYSNRGGSPHEKTTADHYECAKAACARCAIPPRHNPQNQDPILAWPRDVQRNVAMLLRKPGFEFRLGLLAFGSPRRPPALRSLLLQWRTG